MHSQFKWFCQLDNREGGSEQRTGKKVEKQSKLDCLFPRSASDSSVWVTVPLSFSLSLPPSLCASASLALSDYLFAGEGKRSWEGKRRRRRLVSTVMADERERGRFCSVAHLFSLSLSLLPPFSQSVPTQTAKPPPRPPENISLFMFQIFSSLLLHSA